MLRLLLIGIVIYMLLFGLLMPFVAQVMLFFRQFFAWMYPSF